MARDLCRSCGEPIYDYMPRVFAIQGYEETRKQGGQNHVLMKKRLDGWVWHRSCWDLVMKRHRGHGEQTELPL